MANRIAGITVQIGGDTTKLSDALKQVNSEIRSTQSELRDVNRLLKLDPGNTELLSQKHKLLNKWGLTLDNEKQPAGHFTLPVLRYLFAVISLTITEDYATL